MSAGERTYVSTGCTPSGVTSASVIVTMASHPGELPDYDQAPVVEVALAIQFKSAIGFRSFDLGKVAACWSDTLPEVSERPPLGPMAVEFAGPSVAFKVSEETETPRLWLMNEQGSQLLQLQQDRLVVNWRRLPSDTPYPHYVSIREFLVEAWNRLTAVVHDLGRTVPEPSICEVQYVNHLDKHSGWRSVGDTPAVIAPWSGSMSDGFLPPTRDSCRRPEIPAADPRFLRRPEIPAADPRFLPPTRDSCRRPEIPAADPRFLPPTRDSCRRPEIPAADPRFLPPTRDSCRRPEIPAADPRFLPPTRDSCRRPEIPADPRFLPPTRDSCRRPEIPAADPRFLPPTRDSCRRPEIPAADPRFLPPTRDSCRRPEIPAADPRFLPPTRDSCRRPEIPAADPRFLPPTRDSWLSLLFELDFMDLAHEWIVRGFTSITTAEAHTHWRRKTWVSSNKDC